ncbi:hypothetical protein HZA97_00495 [Candidatus Woesearchaeota archaeon]|nr:hypothetical protein [Candidatus Woesearchaeota archaeon]
MGVDDLFWEVWAEDENLDWFMLGDDLEEEKANELIEQLYKKRQMVYWKRPYFVDD